MWVDRDEWINPIETWEGAGEDVDVTEAEASLRRHLLEKWDTPEVLHCALGFKGDERAASVPESAHRIAHAFTEVLAQAGRGDSSVKNALDAALCSTESYDGASSDSLAPVVSKKVAKFFTTPRTEEAAESKANPLHALRRAQVAAQGGATWVGDGVCRSAMGARLLGAGKGGSPRQGVSELFGASLISWVCTHAEVLSEPSAVATAIDYALELRTAQDPTYDLAGRTPKTVMAAMEQYALTAVKFEDDELFEPNPHGVKGLFETGQVIPKGTVVRVPYDEAINGGPGKYELGEGSVEGRGARPCTVRIAEVESLRRLIMVRLHRRSRLPSSCSLATMRTTACLTHLLLDPFSLHLTTRRRATS